MGKTVRDVLVQALENLEKKSFKKFKNKLNDWEIKEGFSRIPKGKLEEADPEDVADLIRRYYKDFYGIEVTLAVLEAIEEKTEAEELRNGVKTVNGGAVQEPSSGADQGATSRGEQRPEGSLEGLPNPQYNPIDTKHFVDRHRAALISRVVLVAPIIDDLYGRLLTPEAYETVRSKATSSEQMRELFRNVESWGNEDKDQFLKSLRKHNSPLIRDLEAKKYYNPSIRQLLPCVCGGSPGGHGRSYLQTTGLQRPGAAAAGPGCPCRVQDGEHFVDRHRAELIRRVKLVDPILDDLHQHKLLTTEAYDTVRSKATSQRQMRELFRHVESWWNKDKDQLLESLRKNNQPFIRNLE
ncbi:apoptosis-associated speck-like protein containing a CARD [Bufo bufo]|uniref:apoptosis-associated speck-like protein containing a CARD n=1 Tax=Bufo bufo TaxID=8384 RepID=UPI001ABE7B91|nr:apoptosis-associated speck-like protein containing a CARD [Bufo bufo]